MQQFQPYEYLFIDIANHRGLDKETWDVRIDWVKDNLSDLESFSEQADDPYMFMKAVRTLRDVQQGKSTGHLVALDATASFLGVLAVLSGCEKTAYQCNLTNSGSRQDFYTNLTTEMNVLLHSQGIVLDVSRKEVKGAAMPCFYGSSAKPKEVFGEDTPELDAFYQALQNLVPGAVLVMKYLAVCWDSTVLNHSWTLPDGFTAVKPVTELVEYKGIKVDELPCSFTYLCVENIPSKNGVSILADSIQSLDAYLVRETLRRCDFDILTIHDAYLCLAGNMQALRGHYQSILIELSKGNTFQDLVRSITGNEAFVWNKLGDITPMIEEAEYFLS